MHRRLPDRTLRLSHKFPFLLSGLFRTLTQCHFKGVRIEKKRSSRFTSLTLSINTRQPPCSSFVESQCRVRRFKYYSRRSQAFEFQPLSVFVIQSAAELQHSTTPLKMNNGNKSPSVPNRTIQLPFLNKTCRQTSASVSVFDSKPQIGTPKPRGLNSHCCSPCPDVTSPPSCDSDLFLL